MGTNFTYFKILLGIKEMHEIPFFFFSHQLDIFKILKSDPRLCTSQVYGESTWYLQLELSKREIILTDKALKKEKIINLCSLLSYLHYVKDKN